MTTAEAGSGAEPAFVVPGDLADNTELWIIRHGETEWSISGQHTGVTDIPLTDNGRRQAAALRAVLADVHPVLVLSSPRVRTVDTAELAGLSVDETTEDLAEWDYGEYEGRSSKDIHRTDPGWTVFSHPTPGGETAARIATRADRVLTRAARAVGDGPVVLVGHGHFSRVLGARWIGLPVSGGAHLQLGTAAPSLLGAEHGVPTVTRWNIPNPST
ncbi:MAG: histidine phosphatase family protein [Gordonia polyisoprenivorans]|nr:histidine phosphatase family protein [Gordonia polyisoprenivorans]